MGNTPKIQVESGGFAVFSRKPSISLKRSNIIMTKIAVDDSSEVAYELSIGAKIEFG